MTAQSTVAVADLATGLVGILMFHAVEGWPAASIFKPE